MLLEDLKQSTSKQHQEAEELNFSSQIFNHNLSLSEYQKLLLRNYYFHLHIEQHLAQLSDLATVPLSQSIAKDLRQFGLATATEDNPLEPKNTDEIIGYLYVRNGSLLGTKIITSHLKKTDALVEEVKNFNFYSADTDYPNWKDILTYIQSHYNSETDVIAGATKAFEYFISLSKRF